MLSFPPYSPPLWILAFAGMTRWGWVGADGLRLPWVSVPPLDSGFLPGCRGRFCFCVAVWSGCCFRVLGGGGASREGRPRAAAPALGSRESGNDGGGGRAGEGCWCRRGGPALAGRAVREPPLRGVGCAEVRVAEGEVPACAGTTKGGSPALAGGRASAPTTGCWGWGGSGGGGGGSRLRGNDDGGVRADAGVGESPSCAQDLRRAQGDRNWELARLG